MVEKKTNRCLLCEEYWNRRLHIKYIINYNKSKYIISDIDLIQKLEDVILNYSSVVKVEKKEIPIKEQFKDEEPKLLEKEKFGYFNYNFLMSALRSDALEDYRQK